MFSSTTVERSKAAIRNLIDQVVSIGLIALAGCSIAAAVASAAPLSGGSMPMSKSPLEWRSLLDRRVIIWLPNGPRTQRVAATVVAPVGEGWG